MTIPDDELPGSPAISSSHTSFDDSSPILMVFTVTSMESMQNSAPSAMCLKSRKGGGFDWSVVVLLILTIRSNLHWRDFVYRLGR